MLYKTFFLAVLLTVAHSWEMNVTENFVVRNVSTNVSLACAYDGNDHGSPKFTEIYSVRILKSKRNDEWDTIAKVSALRPNVESSLVDSGVTGHAGASNNTFLNIDFATVTADTIGQFVCEISGYNENEEYETLKTEKIYISERGINYDDMMDMILNLKNENEGDHADINLKLTLLKKSLSLLKGQEDSTAKATVKNSDEISIVLGEYEQIKTLLSNMPTNSVRDLIKQIEEETTIREKNYIKIENQISNLTSMLKEEMFEQKQLANDVAAVLRKDPSIVWPTGRYGMLKPDTGCPYSPSFQWLNGSKRVTTRPGDYNDDAVSDPSHLGGRVIQHDSFTDYNFVTLEACVSLDQYEGPAWPKGKYCIMGYTSAESDAPGFEAGFINLDRYDTKFYDETINLWHSSSPNYEITGICFWCRSDGYSSTPIVLPNKDPFYLYRYGGRCQEVQGMKVTREWIKYDTMIKKDKYYKPHPDIYTTPVRIELCYYTPE